MRPDMGKVVTERPRAGGHAKRPKGYYRKANKIAPEDQPKRERINQHGYESRTFTDVLGPLRGYVHSVIGHHFDKVYAEIKKALPGDGMSARHVIGHLWQFLERQVIIVNGKPCHLDMHYRYRRVDGVDYIPIYYSKYGPIAYVDPRDRIIKRAPKSPQPKPQKEPLTVLWVDKHLYEKLDGVWYEIQYAPYAVELVPFDARAMYASFWRYSSYHREVLFGGRDVVLNEDVRNLSQYDLKRAHGKPGIYAKVKLQLNSREIKRLGLWREPLRIRKR